MRSATRGASLPGLCPPTQDDTRPIPPRPIQPSSASLGGPPATPCGAGAVTGRQGAAACRNDPNQNLAKLRAVGGQRRAWRRPVTRRGGQGVTGRPLRRGSQTLPAGGVFSVDTKNIIPGRQFLLRGGGSHCQLTWRAVRPPRAPRPAPTPCCWPWLVLGGGGRGLVWPAGLEIGAHGCWRGAGVRGCRCGVPQSVGPWVEGTRRGAGT